MHQLYAYHKGTVQVRSFQNISKTTPIQGPPPVHPNRKLEVNSGRGLLKSRWSSASPRVVHRDRELEYFKLQAKSLGASALGPVLANKSCPASSCYDEVKSSHGRRGIILGAQRLPLCPVANSKSLDTGYMNIHTHRLETTRGIQVFGGARNQPKMSRNSCFEANLGTIRSLG